MAIDAALRSVNDAIASLQRQRKSLSLRYRLARSRETPEEHARAVGRNMARMFMQQVEDEGGAA